MLENKFKYNHSTKPLKPDSFYVFNFKFVIRIIKENYTNYLKMKLNINIKFGRQNWVAFVYIVLSLLWRLQN